MAAGQLPAQVADRGVQSQQLQLERMQSVREVVHGGRDLRSALPQLRRAPRDVGILTGHDVAQTLQLERQQREPLAHIVVQQARNPPAFVLLRCERGGH